MYRPRAFLSLWLACVASACLDGSAPTEGGRAVPLDLRPSFQVDPVLFPSDPVDRIRLLATDAETAEQVGSADEEVSPTAAQWTLSLGIALDDAPSRDVLVDVELLSGSAVQWSGRLGPIHVRAGDVSPAQNVDLHRGPLDNLDVVALDVPGAPTWIAVGGTALLVANPTLLPGSTATPSVFWASSNAAVATVSSEGPVATVTGVAAGTTEIVAVAGSMSVELDLEVRAVAPPGFDLEWRGTTSDWHTASNWSTGQVPTATDDVFIPASAVEPLTNADVTIGGLTVAAGATLAVGDFALTVGGDLHVDGLLTGGNLVTLTGDGVTVRGTIESALHIAGGAVSTSGPLSVSGDLTVDSSFDVGGARTVAVSGTVVLASGAMLVVDGILTAVGGCVDNGATISGAGQHPCGPSSFDKTWVGGAVGAPSDWHTAANWSPTGVPGPSDAVQIPADLSVSLSQDAAVGSLIAPDFVSIDLGGFTLSVGGDADLGQALVSNGLIRITGAGSVLRGNFADLEITTDRVLSGPVYTGGDLTISAGYLDPNGQPVTIAGDLLVVGPTSQLVMIRPGDVVHASGNVLFDGADHTNILQNGTLSLEGDFTVTSRTATGFAASASHTLYFVGSGTQQVSFALPGSGQQRAANVLIASTLATTFVTSVHAIENVTVTGSWSVPANSTVTIDGLLAMYPGSSLLVDGAVTAAGGCSNYGGIIQGRGTHPCPPPPAADYTWVGGDTSGSPVAWENPANWQPNGVPSASETVYVPLRINQQPLLTAAQAVSGLFVDAGAILDLGGFTLSVGGDVTVNGSGSVTNGLLLIDGQGGQLEGNFDHVQITAPVTLSDVTRVDGDLDVQAPVTVGPHLLLVTGNFAVGTPQGSVIMTDASGAISVEGTTAFEGASTLGLLTEGAIYLSGDLYVLSLNSREPFAPTGTDVWLSGANDQTLDFDAPGAGQSFADLWIYKSAGSVLLGSNVLVSGTLYADAATITAPIGAAFTLEVRGGLSLSQTVFDGVPLRLATTQPSGHSMSAVTFTNMPATATQLYIALPADGLSPFLIQSPVFNTVPLQGGLYLHVANTTQAATLDVQVASPMPAARPSQISTQGVGLVNIVWPYP